MVCGKDTDNKFASVANIFYINSFTKCSITQLKHSEWKNVNISGWYTYWVLHFIWITFSIGRQCSFTIRSFIIYFSYDKWKSAQNFRPVFLSSSWYSIWKRQLVEIIRIKTRRAPRTFLMISTGFFTVLYTWRILCHIIWQCPRAYGREFIFTYNTVQYMVAVLYGV